jgi:hypothetical protein
MERGQRMQPHYWHFEPRLIFVMLLLNIASVAISSINREYISYAINNYIHISVCIVGMISV